MSRASIRRRLAAFLQADAVGFSRLVHGDEAGTHERLAALRSHVIDQVVDDHRGHMIKTMGDGFLCEFASVVDATNCALDWQARVAEHETSTPETERFVFRIGIGLGDVIDDGDDVFGEGVTLAARLESMADPGGVLITEDAFRQVVGKVAGSFSDLGPQVLKNIPAPVRVYAVSDEASPHSPLRRPGAREKPSIVVLPFVNRGHGEDDGYFADGITEDITTALSRIRWFLVIARSTSFAYRESTLGARRIAEELDVAYVLEGSVRRSGDRVRVTTELIDGRNGTQLWSHRFDREVADIFAMQDEITATIVGAIEPELGRAERDRAKRKRPENLAAWDVYQRGMAHLYNLSKKDLVEARLLFDEALAIDPTLGPALSGLAEVDYYEVVLGFAESSETNRDRALAAARRAVALDPDDAGAHGTLGRVHYMRGEHETSILELETALELNPSYALAHYGLGSSLIFSGHAEQGLPHLETAMRLSPRDANMGSFLVRLADASLLLDDPEGAVRWARKALQQPNFQWSRYSVLLAALGRLGRLEEAALVLKELRSFQSDFSVEWVRAHHLYTDPAYFDKYLGGLREAGVPET